MRPPLLLIAPPLVLLAAFAGSRCGGLAEASALPPPCDSAYVATLPLVERPATSDTNATLVVLLTGDGGWANADEKVAEGLRARGAAVVGLNMRRYLSQMRTPDETANAVACIADTFLHRWNRSRLMLLGYSRGADVAPFVVTRLRDDLRNRLNLVALVSPGMDANFRFHLIDLLKDVKRPDDIPIAPELARLRGLPVLCVYGTEDRDSVCRVADSTAVTRYARPGGHRIAGGFDVMADVLARGLAPPP